MGELVLVDRLEGLSDMRQMKRMLNIERLIHLEESVFENTLVEWERMVQLVFVNSLDVVGRVGTTLAGRVGGTLQTHIFFKKSRLYPAECQFSQTSG